MQSLLFVVVAIALYFVSDRLLLALEARAGRRFDNRSLVFFAILLGLALVTFSVIRHASS